MVAIFLINWSPSSALYGDILDKVYSGKIINYSFLKVFYCIASAYVDQKMRRKFDSKSQKCAFIGYGGDEYGFSHRWPGPAARRWTWSSASQIWPRDVQV